MFTADVAVRRSSVPCVRCHDTDTSALRSTLSWSHFCFGLEMDPIQLHMLGYPVDFASFYILEVMSRTEFAHKRVGYLAAAQVFSPTTDVLLLTTNLFKKVRFLPACFFGLRLVGCHPTLRSYASGLAHQPIILF